MNMNIYLVCVGTNGLPVNIIQTIILYLEHMFEKIPDMDYMNLIIMFELIVQMK